jgi:hypothetical protein
LSSSKLLAGGTGSKVAVVPSKMETEVTEKRGPDPGRTCQVPDFTSNRYAIFGFDAGKTTPEKKYTLQSGSR